ncbi:MAG TPA: hypothetical protein ENG62_01490, partial [Thermoplasmatales archaeon]|nr:hypothetical protein [Thermoplasmatales archaeon]
MVILTPLSEAVISTPHQFEAEIDSKAIPLFLGEINLSGETYGVEGETLVDLSEYQDLLSNPLIGNIFNPGILENPRFLPLIGSTYFEDIDELLIIDTTILGKLENLSLE